MDGALSYVDWNLMLKQARIKTRASGGGVFIVI